MPLYYQTNVSSIVHSWTWKKRITEYQVCYLLEPTKEGRTRHTGESCPSNLQRRKKRPRTQHRDTAELELQEGLQQGSALSALLFIIVMDVLAAGYEERITWRAVVCR